VLGHAADHRELVIPAHFAEQSVAEVRRDGGTFAITGWVA
jgi:hypothetical protein